MRVRINLVITCLLLAVDSIHAQSIWDGAHLQKVKQSLHQPYFSTTYQELVAEAEKLLDVQPLSVVMKETPMHSPRRKECGRLTLTRSLWR